MIMTRKEIEDRIRELENRKDMARFQRKITTQLLTVLEYDVEIGAIDRRLEQLHYALKKEHITEKQEQHDHSSRF